MTTPPPYPSNPPYPPNQPYGQMPGYQQQPRLPRPAVPSTVTTAFILFLVSAAAGIFVAVYLLSDTGRAEVREAIRTAQGVQLPDPSEFETVVSVAIALASGIVLVIGALFVFFAFMMRAGRNWARIVLTVLTGLSIASGLSGGGTGGGMHWSNWVSLVLSIVALVFMFLAPSNEYFRRSKQFRAQQQLIG